VFEDRALLFVSNGIHIDAACYTACSVRTGDIVETCYLRVELLLNPTGVGNSAMLAVNVALESVQSKGVCTYTGRTGAGSDSGAGCNVNKWVFSHAAGPAN
jgi:hypothetical protein